MDASDRIDWRKNVSSLSMSSLIKQGLDTKVKPVEADMKKALPIILILLGIAELIIALMDIKLPVVIAVVLGALFIVLGVKTLLDPDKKE